MNENGGAERRQAQQAEGAWNKDGTTIMFSAF